MENRKAMIKHNQEVHGVKYGPGKKNTKAILQHHVASSSPEEELRQIQLQIDEKLIAMEEERTAAQKRIIQLDNLINRYRQIGSVPQPPH